MSVVDEVYAQARTNVPAGQEVGAYDLARAYAARPDTDPLVAARLMLAPPAVASFAIGVLLTKAVKRVGPTADDLLRITVWDPRCGVGVSLLAGARHLARVYALRTIGGEPTNAQVAALLPQVIVSCVFGMDEDPTAVELARLALSLATGAALPADTLARNVIVGTPDSSSRPPAMRERPADAVDLLTASKHSQ